MRTTADIPAYLRNPPRDELLIPSGPLEDPALPHQVTHRVLPGSLLIAVGCNCRATRWIEARESWEPGEALAAWLDYHTRERH